MTASRSIIVSLACVAGLGVSSHAQQPADAPVAPPAVEQTPAYQIPERYRVAEREVLRRLENPPPPPVTVQVTQQVTQVIQVPVSARRCAPPPCANPAVVYQSPPTVVVSEPVSSAAPPVVYSAPPVVYAAPQVVYTRPQVVYTQPEVIYAPAPVYVAPCPPRVYRYSDCGPSRGYYGYRGYRPGVSLSFSFGSGHGDRSWYRGHGGGHSGGRHHGHSGGRSHRR